MIQYRTYTFMNALRAMLVATMMLLTGTNALAQNTGVKVHGNVFGGGNNAGVKKNTFVNISTGAVDKNVYGGGNLGDVGTIDKTDQTTYNYIWTDNSDADDDNDTGICNVNISGGTIGAANASTANHASGHVFGAGKGSGENTFWCEKGMVYKTNVSITKGTIYGNVYGGGEVGRVENDATVTMGASSETDAPEVKGSVFGAGAGLETHGYSALVRNNTYVTIQDYAKVRMNVYGGGEIATVGRYWVNTDPLPTGAPPVPDGTLPGLPYQQRSGGVSTVKVEGHAEIGPKDAAATETSGHVFGAGKGATPNYISSGTGKSQKMTQSGALVDFTGNAETGKTAEQEYKEFLESLALVTHTFVTIGGSATGTDTKVKGSVYGGSENGFVQHNTSVSILNGSTIGTSSSSNSYGYIYGGGKGYAGFAAAGRVTGHVTIEVGGGTAYGSVYGGGELGITKGGVDVNVTGGIIKKDVYGGGALADTNTDEYELVTGLTSTSSVKGLYTKTNNTYTEVTTETTAAANTDYYRITATNVNLTNGTVEGDVYGGGLGDSSHEPLVYGDVTVNIGKATVSSESTTYSGDATIGGSVYGCNNFKGTPKGDVVVNIYKTAHTTGDVNNQYPNITTLEGLNGLSNDDDRFAIKAVYGGGNLAAYTPSSTGHSTTVHIYGCTENTVKTVYGGGNAADVGTTGTGAVSANTNVIIEGGRFDQVFGGGNGYSSTGNHNNPSAANYNPGANIYGTATTDIQGGLYGQVFGGSNQYGNVTSTSLSINKLCDYLLIKESFGGANEADITGDVTTTLGCGNSGIQIGSFYGGSNLAKIEGNVTLNVEGGVYTNVFGGSKGTSAKAADITGDVTLNLYGGTMDNAFGGSDVNGPEMLDRRELDLPDDVGRSPSIGFVDGQDDAVGIVLDAVGERCPGSWPEDAHRQGILSMRR